MVSKSNTANCFAGNLPKEAAIVFTIEGAKETALVFSQGTVKVF